MHKTLNDFVNKYTQLTFYKWTRTNRDLPHPQNEPIWTRYGPKWARSVSPMRVTFDKNMMKPETKVTLTSGVTLTITVQSNTSPTTRTVTVSAVGC